MSINHKGGSLLDTNEKPQKETVKPQNSIDCNVHLEETVLNRLKNYSLDEYISDCEKLGLEKTWDYICLYIMKSTSNLPKVLDVDNLGELYEVGLAIQDKRTKKKSGIYYTPDDVARVMSVWLDKCEGEAVCDVGCGSGKLILTYLNYIGYEKARELISRGLLYLYDCDSLALKICKTVISVKYGLDIWNNINGFCCDFLDKDILLPKNCKVICNPPYARLEQIESSWQITDVLSETREFYSVFMEKIFTQAYSTVIITPFSFISGKKFYSLRRLMTTVGGGFIVSFDNVPGNIFCGKKHGIFNTNTANSVRAAITVLNKKMGKGFRVSPLIRFKNEQRSEVLDCSVLEEILPDEVQIIDKINPHFKKIDKKLISVFSAWQDRSALKVKDFLAKYKTEYMIDMPNTCRYYTTASHRKLKRTGAITFYIKDKEAYDFLYCFINSSFAYWWWRIFDGGITYPVSLFYDMPLPFNLLREEDKRFFSDMREFLINEEKKFIITKVNAGAPQENIKFPKEYRSKINNRILKILGFDIQDTIFDTVHANEFKD